MAHLVGGLFLALVQCRLHLLCHFCTHSFSAEGLHDRTKWPPHWDTPFGVPFIECSNRISGRPIQTPGMAHRNWRGCIINFNVLLQLQLFVSTPRHLDGNLFSNDSRSYLFPSPRNVKNRKCWIGIWRYIHLLEYRLICCALSCRKDEGFNRLRSMELRPDLSLLPFRYDLHLFHPSLPKQNFIDNPIFKH